MKKIPGFPAFRALEIGDRAELEGYLKRHPDEVSDYNFTSLFAWQRALRYHLCRWGEGFFIRGGSPGNHFFLQPLVPGERDRAVGEALDYLAGDGSTPVIWRAGERFVESLSTGLFRVTPARKDFDYLYRTADLVGLKGDDYHAKSNLCRQFERLHPGYRYRDIEPAMTGECIDFIHEWCRRRECDKVRGMTREKCAVIRMLQHFPRLELVGGLIEIDGRVRAMSLAGPLNPDTIVIHAEKADERIRGIYQVINRDFLARHGAQYPFVNREEDLGLPGLRKAKKSYHPCRMIRKFEIAPA